MYVCALRPSGEPLSREDLFGHIAALRSEDGGSPQIVLAGPFGAIVRPVGRGGRARLAQRRHLIAVGDARFDNRDELRRLTADGLPEQGDLDLLLRLWERHGERCIERLVGDYAFVVWDPRAHKLVAARDAFGVKPLYHAEHAGLATFASHASPLRQRAELDLDYLAGFAAGQPRQSERTLWAGVRSVPAGSCVVQRGTVARTQVHWSAGAFEPRDGSTTADDVAAFRATLGEAVRAQMGAPAETWAHLSGGLDSSSIAAVAATECGGLGGTLTVVDTLGAGDEREYSDAVARRFGLRNEQVVDYWAWQDDGSAPPRLDQPWPLYPFFARDRRVREVVRAGGARVVLAGVGADHHLSGNLGYIRDLAVCGEVGAAAREIAAWAADTRTSFWGMARQIIGRSAGFGPESASPLPPWLLHGANGTRPADEARRGTASRRASAFADGIAAELALLPAWLERLEYGPDVEVRYPFLHRPLVELVLRLPRDARIRPLERKWILREAMRGVLPEKVRTRRGKGGIDARVLWSLQRERRRVDALLADAQLARLGVVCAKTLCEAVAAARNGICDNPVQLMSTLALETWLAVHAGSDVMRTSPASHAA